MKQWEDKFKERLEGFEMKLPASDRDAFLNRKATRERFARRRRTYINLAVGVPAAAAVILVIILSVNLITRQFESLDQDLLAYADKEQFYLFQSAQDEFLFEDYSTEDPEFEPVNLISSERKPVPPPPAAPKAEIIDIMEDDADIQEDIIASTEDNMEWVDISKYEIIEAEPEPEDDIYMVVEIQPEFPGGTAALLEYLKNNIKYPEACRDNNIQGRVIVSFIVEKDGSIVSPKILKSVHPQLDAEAVRVISGMPNWSPGIQRGEPCRVKYTIPVNFRLN